MIPWHRADEVLDDLALDLDERRNVLGILRDYSKDAGLWYGSRGAFVV